jgi:hypothetical protein
MEYGPSAPENAMRVAGCLRGSKQQRRRVGMDDWKRGKDGHVTLCTGTSFEANGLFGRATNPSSQISWKRQGLAMKWKIEFRLALITYC